MINLLEADPSSRYYLSKRLKSEDESSLMSSGRRCTVGWDDVVEVITGNAASAESCSRDRASGPIQRFGQVVVFIGVGR